MTVKEFMNLSPADLSRMTERELRQAVGEMASAANKRLKRLGEVEGGTSSPGYRAAMKRGKFSPKGKTRDQLLGEAGRIQRFMNYKTGSVRGFKAYQRSVYEHMKSKYESTTNEEMLPYRAIDKTEFWKIYRKYEEQHPDEFVNNNGSADVYMDLVDIIKEKGEASLELLNLMRKHGADGGPVTYEEYVGDLHEHGLNVKKRGRRRGLWEE